MNKINKSLRKRFLIAAVFFMVIFLITKLSSPIAFEDMANKTVVLKEAPDFVKKRNGNSNDYRIVFSFKGKDSTLEISGADLEYADRQAIQNELKANDTIDIKWHHIFIAQITKNSKTYMLPENAKKQGEETDKFMFWMSLISGIICLIGVFIVNLNIKFIGWVATALIIIITVVLFLVIGVKFSNAGEYTEFKVLSNLLKNTRENIG
jgi:hypothetical protein